VLAAGASLVALLEFDPEPEMPVFNARFATLAMVFAAGALIAELQLRAAERRANAPALAELVVWLALPLLVLAVSLDTYDFVDGEAWGSGACWFVMAGLWALIALGVHAWAIHRRLKPTRLLTLMLFGGAAIMALLQLSWPSLHEATPAFANLRFAAFLIIGASMAVAAWLEHRQSAESPIPEDLLWAPGVLLLALAASAETYFAVAEVATAASAETGLLAATAVWAFLSVLVVAAGTSTSVRSLLPLGLVMTCTAVTVTILVSETVDADLWPPVVNLRTLAFVVCIGALAAESRLTVDAGSSSDGDQGGSLSPVLAVSAALLALWPLTKEVYVAFMWSEYPSAEMWRDAAQVAISLSWAGYALVSLAWGMTRRSRVARWLGLIVLAAGVLKLFLWDLSFLAQPYRILSFGVLGLVLVGVAWAYSRYGDRLRDLA
jgi:hypothetical protein